MNPEIIVPRITEIDGGGFPGEPLWAAAPQLALVRARDGGPVVFGTRVRLLDDGRRLIVRFDCEDCDVWSTHARRDAPLWEEEVVEIFMAPGDGVPASYAEIQVNPLGTIFDAQVLNPDGRRDTMRVDASWDASGLSVQVARESLGWRAEIALPWSEVCAGATPRVWRANFFRVERPRAGDPEFSCWSPTLADPPDFHKPSAFGRLLRIPGPG